MRDKAFFDSNVVLYLYSDDEPNKSKKCQKLISGKGVFLSTQVLGEFTNVLIKKFNETESVIEKAIKKLMAVFTIYAVGPMTILKALKIRGKYKYSYYDSLIIAAASETSCNILYSEDLHDGQVIENKLKIVNPFK